MLVRVLDLVDDMDLDPQLQLLQRRVVLSLMLRRFVMWVDRLHSVCFFVHCE